VRVDLFIRDSDDMTYVSFVTSACNWFEIIFQFTKAAH